MADRVLVIGSGGREHALAWKLAQSPHVKQFCKDHNIGFVIAGPEAMLAADFPALVVKPSGFGPRKEVILASNREEACKATQAILQFLCFMDGVTFASMPPVQVQKQLLDGGQGPSPVAIGAYGPVPQASEVLLEKIKITLLQHIIDCMKQEGMSYVGVLQIELILEKDGVKVISMDCNFGDPQCQVVLQLLNYDLYEVIQAALNGRLCDTTLLWSKNLTAVSVVMACEGYTECHNKNTEITGLLQAKELGLEIFHGATILKNDKVLTNGSRVLTVTAMKQDLMSALEAAYRGLEIIYFQDATYRNDVFYCSIYDSDVFFLFRRPLYEDKIADFIASSTLGHPSKLPSASGYKSGSVHQQGMPAFFDLRASGYIDPILVSQTKGIGTKQKIAQLCNKHDTIGQDLVAMSVNDILALGAEPLFFLYHFTYGKLDAGVAPVIAEGIAEACEMAGCSLLARESSEMSGTWAAGEYNLVGFAVGAVDQRMRLPQQKKIANGDVLIGIASSGLHGQGFSLVRKIILTSSPHYLSSVPSGCGPYTLGEQLLTPSKIYSKVLLPLFRSGNVKAWYPQVEIKNLFAVLLQNKHLYLKSVSAVDGQLQNMQRTSKVKVAVLISGTGTSLAALLTYAKEPASSAQIVLVIADRSGVEELKNATLAGIPTRVIDHKLYGSRSEYDGTIDRVLDEFSVELICLARFTREDTSLEAVILQEPASVMAEDTKETLLEKVKEAENRAFPIALQLVASGMVQLAMDHKTYWN
ncbi:hypothetical protein JD844_032722 [Phrynosoma platyrhinos]|uniref:phosphoribosylformylglycinamidine cyclo-ligase n=1 Tax=Phrynosoma platyrhinos TaxID=52577 RepID=A0ABQ7T5R9_PHRPL|nr:hypothetical protein JD844_032722 [Phrynosoma platyrhinos]